MLTLASQDPFMLTFWFMLRSVNNSKLARYDYIKYEMRFFYKLYFSEQRPLKNIRETNVFEKETTCGVDNKD